MPEPRVAAGYCPWHEYEWTECCGCCLARRRELRRIDNQLRTYFSQKGFHFVDRGRLAYPRRQQWRRAS
jgi:hypothetical protein